MRLLAAALMLAGLPVGAAAQWRVGLDMAFTRYAGSSRDTTAQGGPRLHPAPSLMGTIVVERWTRSWGLSLRIGYANTGVRAIQETISLTDKSIGGLVEPALLFGYQVGGIGPSGAVKIQVGPALPLWTSEDDEFDGKYAVVGALAYEWSVAGKVTGVLRVEGLLSPSWFDANELPPELQRVSTRRYGIGLGLRYRL